MTHRPRHHRAALGLAVLASGVAGLTWEVLWQHHTALALGVSSYGTAVTLAAMMAGLACGGLLAARLARRGKLRRPLFAYGVAELMVGAGALAVPFGLDGLAFLDRQVYAVSPAAAAALHLLGMLALLLIPATAMGTTLAILAPWAVRAGTTLDVLYTLNLAGALAGVLATTFVMVPLLGIFQTGLATAALNFAVALWAISQASDGEPAAPETRAVRPRPAALGLAAASGFAVFVLEVSWFRSIRAALQSTTESFALILASFLLALAAGSWLASRLRRRVPALRTPDVLRWVLGAAGLAILCATPAVDGFDRWTHRLAGDWIPDAFSLALGVERLGWILLPVAIPITLLGMVFPWLLAEHATTRGSGRLIAVNTLGSVAGALVAGFVLLPWLGATRTSWLAGLAVLAAAAALAPRPRALAALAAATALGLGVAGTFGGEVARSRVQGAHARAYGEVLYLDEGPDSTVWVARQSGDGRRGLLDLVIDGFPASGEHPRSHYMAWMGHLPALAVPGELGDALVICFGTGQTAHAVRQHRPERLFVVDVNRAVLDAAPLFRSNRGVLDDPAVSAMVMDGRAFLRREERRYDLVTLEPMPPNFAGSNSLYSQEFYELVRARLAPGAVAAQWVPFHLLVTEHMRAVVATFHQVFPFTRLWIDPDSGTGILVGSAEPWELHPSRTPLPWPEAKVAEHMELGWDAVAALSEGAPRITDDNQLLAYGPQRFARVRAGEDGWSTRQPQENLALVRWFRAASPSLE